MKKLISFILDFLNVMAKVLVKLLLIVNVYTTWGD